MDIIFCPGAFQTEIECDDKLLVCWLITRACTYITIHPYGEILSSVVVIKHLSFSDYHGYISPLFLFASILPHLASSAKQTNESGKHKQKEKGSPGT